MLNTKKIRFGFFDVWLVLFTAYNVFFAALRAAEHNYLLTGAHVMSVGFCVFSIWMNAKSRNRRRALQAHQQNMFYTSLAEEILPPSWVLLNNTKPGETDDRTP